MCAVLAADANECQSASSPMTAPPVFEIKADSVRNLIRISYHGQVNAAALKALAAQAAVVVRRIRPGFTVLTDLSRLENMTLGCVPHLSKIMDLFKAKGIGTAIRVIPDPKKDIGLTILAIIHYDSGVRILTCQTLAEAEAAMKS